MKIKRHVFALAVVLAIASISSCNGGGGSGDNPPIIIPPVVPACQDGIDNDGDGSIDLSDSGCVDATDMSEYSENECDDGLDNDGDTFSDMDDPGCLRLSDRSELGLAMCDDGIDNDGDALVDLADPGCSGPSDTSERGTLECDDGVDNDGDTLVDMNDPGCTTVMDSSESGANECDDGVDNDGDTLTDILDPTCLGDPSGLTETGPCMDGMDNDGDTSTDFPADPGCTDPNDNDELGVTACDDGIDNDTDTLTDYPDDPGCSTIIDNDEGNWAIECDDGFDNDGDTLVDFPNDAGCGSPLDDIETDSDECNDGMDNDGDTFTDFPNDPGCIDAADKSELGVTQCDDGMDNDRDTLIDMNDPGCSVVSDVSELSTNECDDGIDNDGDTQTDWQEDPGCQGAADINEYLGTECDDGIDNDGDTFIDWPADPGCNRLADTTERFGLNECDDGIDNDGDTLTDLPDDPDCPNISGTSEYSISNWVEIGAGSASGAGISNNNGGSLYPDLALDSSGNPVVAWEDTTSGSQEIYIRRWNGSAWVEIGAGSASGGGISNSIGYSWYPSIALDSTDNPVVAWEDYDSGVGVIYIKRFNPSGGGTWEEIGTGSASGGGISETGKAGRPSLAIDSAGNPVVAWRDSTSGNVIYIKRFNGSLWEEIGAGSASGGGISNGSGSSSYPSLALDSAGNPTVAWQDYPSSSKEIYIKRFNGSLWEEIGTGSASGGGISNSSDRSLSPSLALDSAGDPVVTWYNYTGGTWDIHIKRFNGSAWVEIGAGSASGGGISNNIGYSWYPSIALDSAGNPVVTWNDYTLGGNMEIYVRRWQP